MLQQTFTQLLSNYTGDKSLISTLWQELEHNYSQPRRHYHTLKHLEHLLSELTLVKDSINDWDTILFTLFYHDAVYNTLKSDNEEKSADLARARLQKLVSPAMLEACIQQILATKKHLPADNDTNFFTDADLSILGQERDRYLVYTKSVRREYSNYPDILYHPGRKKVLLHFLSMERIYKTGHFYNRYEQAARTNLRRELEGSKQ